MPASFPRIDAALGACGKQIAALDPADADSLEIETGLLSHLIVLVVSEYEVFLEGAFGIRADRCGDPHVASYVRNQLERRFRSPDLGKVNETLGAFGSVYVAAFRAAVENTPEHAAWDNLIRARHAIVHRQGTLNMTFREFTSAYPSSVRVIDHLLASLGIP